MPRAIICVYASQQYHIEMQRTLALGRQAAQSGKVPASGPGATASSGGVGMLGMHWLSGMHSASTMLLVDVCVHLSAVHA